MGNTFKVALIYTARELVERLKAYIHLERVEERLGGAYLGTSRHRETPPRERSFRSSPLPKKQV